MILHFSKACSKMLLMTLNFLIFRLVSRKWFRFWEFLWYGVFLWHRWKFPVCDVAVHMCWLRWGCELGPFWRISSENALLWPGTGWRQRALWQSDFTAGPRETPPFCNSKKWGTTPSNHVEDKNSVVCRVSC